MTRACRLTGGDVDADWQNAAGAGDEAVGGSTAILAERDRHRWQLEREMAREERRA